MWLKQRTRFYDEPWVDSLNFTFDITRYSDKSDRGYNFLRKV